MSEAQELSTREHIVQRAAPVFNRQGYAGAAMSDIMAATGLQKGGLYWHFGSKEELALEAFDFAAARTRERLEAGLGRGDGAPARLHAFVDAYRTLFDDSPVAGGSPLLNTAVEADDGPPALRARAAAAAASLAARLRHTVLDGRIRGQLRPDTDAYVTASLLLSALEGALALARLHGDPRPLDEVGAALHAWIEGQRG